MVDIFSKHLSVYQNIESKMKLHQWSDAIYKYINDFSW